MLVNVRTLYLFLSRCCIEVFNHFYIPQVVANNFPNLRAIQFNIYFLAIGGNPSHVCPISLCEDSADSLVL